MRNQKSPTVALLLVEENAQKVASLQFVLSCAGYTVFVATSEEAAVASVSRERIQLVLIGEEFIANRGFVLCGWLRRLFPVPIIVIAPLCHPDDLTTALQFGVDDYIIKPVHHTMLLARITAVLQRCRRSKTQPRYNQCRSL